MAADDQDGSLATNSEQRQQRALVHNGRVVTEREVMKWFRKNVDLKALRAIAAAMRSNEPLPHFYFNDGCEVPYTINGYAGPPSASRHVLTQKPIDIQVGGPEGSQTSRLLSFLFPGFQLPRPPKNGTQTVSPTGYNRLSTEAKPVTSQKPMTRTITMATDDHDNLLATNIIERNQRGMLHDLGPLTKADFQKWYSENVDVNTLRAMGAAMRSNEPLPHFFLDDGREVPYTINGYAGPPSASRRVLTQQPIDIQVGSPEEGSQTSRILPFLFPGFPWIRPLRNGTRPVSATVHRPSREAKSVHSVKAQIPTVAMDMDDHYTSLASDSGQRKQRKLPQRDRVLMPPRELLSWMDENVHLESLPPLGSIINFDGTNPRLIINGREIPYTNNPQDLLAAINQGRVRLPLPLSNEKPANTYSTDEPLPPLPPPSESVEASPKSGSSAGRNFHRSQFYNPFQFIFPFQTTTPSPPPPAKRSQSLLARLFPCYNDDGTVGQRGQSAYSEAEAAEELAAAMAAAKQVLHAAYLLQRDHGPQSQATQATQASQHSLDNI